ncbi:host attachment family protein [Arenibacterium sp. CAU 1754]
MAKLKNGTWIVVADSEKALLMRNVTDDEDPHFEIIGREDQTPANEPADQPGRNADTAPGAKSAMQGTDWHALARDGFAKDLSDLLYSHAHKGAFDNLVIAAAPQLLGALRLELHSEVEKRIIAEIPKTLTNHPVRQLEALIKAELDGQ